MTLLSARIRVLCPKTHEEIEVHKKCVPKGEPNCPYFEHVAYHGRTYIYIKCKYGGENNVWRRRQQLRNRRGRAN